MKAIEEYLIEFDYDKVFTPGDELRGTVNLVTTQPIKYRAIRVQLKGEGHCSWTRGTGGDRERYSGTMCYLNERTTLFGSLYRTSTITDAGKNAVFNAPWSPSEGKLVIPLEENGTTRQLLVQVMDEEDIKKDQLIAETVIDLKSITYGARTTQPLFHKGKRTDGTVSYTARWVTLETSASAVELLFHDALNLRNPNWLERSDVYIRVYLPEDPYQSYNAEYSALPNPDKKTTLEPGTYRFPFKFRLPEGLPPSLWSSIAPHCFIKYIVYSSIQVDWKLNPKVCEGFTVIPPVPVTSAELYHTGTHGESSKSLGQVCCIPPFCCFTFELPCIRYGDISFSMRLPRLGYVPGEVVPIQVSAANDSSRNGNIEVYIDLVETLRAEGHTSTSHRKMPLLQPIPVPSGDKVQTTLQARIPELPPTFEGVGDDRRGWLQANRPQAVTRFQDPIVWTYYIGVRLNMSQSKGIAFEHNIWIATLGQDVQLIPEAPVVLDPRGENNNNAPVDDKKWVELVLGERANVTPVAPKWKEMVDVDYLSNSKFNFRSEQRFGGAGAPQDDGDGNKAYVPKYPYYG